MPNWHRYLLERRDLYQFSADLVGRWPRRSGNVRQPRQEIFVSGDTIFNGSPLRIAERDLLEQTQYSGRSAAGEIQLQDFNGRRSPA
jgi:hypothetical protein